MDIKRYKKFALSKIDEGNLTRGVKSIIKNEKNKEQNFKEGINPSVNRRNLEKLNSLISDVSSNRSKYNIRDDIVDNLEMLNYNLLRLINKGIGGVPMGGVPPPYDPPAQLLPVDYGGDDDDDDFVFPPPPPAIDDDEGDPFPTLPLPPPAPPAPPAPPIVPPSTPINTIIPEARSRANLLDAIRNPRLTLKPSKSLGPPIPIKPLKSEKPKNINVGKTLLNTIDKIMQRRSAIQDSSDEDEDEDEEEEKQDWE